MMCMDFLSSHRASNIRHLCLVRQIIKIVYIENVSFWYTTEEFLRYFWLNDCSFMLLWFIVIAIRIIIASCSNLLKVFFVLWCAFFSLVLFLSWMKFNIAHKTPHEMIYLRFLMWKKLKSIKKDFIISSCLSVTNIHHSLWSFHFNIKTR